MRLLYLAILPTCNGKILLTKKLHTYVTEHGKNQTGSHLEPFSVMINFYNAERCYRYYYRRKVITHIQLCALRTTVMNDLERKVIATIVA